MQQKMLLTPVAFLDDWPRSQTSVNGQSRHPTHNIGNDMSSDMIKMLFLQILWESYFHLPKGASNPLPCDDTSPEEGKPTRKGENIK